MRPSLPVLVLVTLTLSGPACGPGGPSSAQSESEMTTGRPDSASGSSEDGSSKGETDEDPDTTGSEGEAGTDTTDAEDSDTDSDTDSGSPTGECGDGTVDPGERCDDGNREGGDLCSADCRHPVFACGDHLYRCGDTIDNDDDGLVDLDDPDCISPCDHAEDRLELGIPGQNCECCGDCMFDDNTGMGDDLCDDQTQCDPLDPSPECPYNQNATCYQQIPQCFVNCGPLTPNGCDCFGCCILAGTPRWIGGWNGCSAANLEDCSPCTITPECFDPCESESCELCFLQGFDALAPGCEEPSCSDGQQPCDDPYACPDQQFCQAGCCRGLSVF